MLLAALLLTVSGLAIWSSIRASAAADLALQHTRQTGDLRELITCIIQQYQAQADTVINFHVDGKDFEDARKDFEKHQGKFAAMATNDEEKQWAMEMERLDAEYCAIYRNQVLPAVRRQLAAPTADEKVAISAEITKLDDQSDELIARVETIARKGILALTAKADTARQEYSQFASEVRRTIVFISLVALVAGLALGFWVATSTSKSITRVAAQLESGSGHTFQAASQVSSASQALAEGASSQAASIEETSASLEEMASMTKRNSDNALKANELARRARSVAERGSEDMRAMADAMQSIKASSNEISKIIRTIDEIAFQTNILALNAAVEAARAGEAGMGFAVVADEVRNLAQRSARAAKETAAKIENAVSNTAQGVQISEKVTGVLNDIVATVREVDELVAEVSNASREQTHGISQINVAVAQLDKTTQSNAANAQESSAAAQELNAQAFAMKETVAALLVMVSDNDAVSAQNSFTAAVPRPKLSPAQANGPAHRTNDSVKIARAESAKSAAFATASDMTN